MPKSKSRKKAKKVNQTKSNLDLGVAIYREHLACGRVEDPDPTALFSQIDRAIYAGAEEALFDALSLCSTAEDVSSLASGMCLTAETCDVSLGLGDGSAIEDTATLVAIPIVFMGKNVPDVLPSGTTDMVAKSLRKHRLAHEKSSVIMMSGLFRLEEIPVGFCSTRNLLLDFVHGFSSRSVPGVSRIPQSGNEDATVAVRYIVGAIICCDDGILGEEDSEEVATAAFAGWVADVEPVIQESLSFPGLMLLPPSSYFEGVREGVCGFLEVGLSLIFAEAIEACEWLSTDLHLEVGISEGVPLVLLKDGNSETLAAEPINIPNIICDPNDIISDVLMALSSGLNVPIAAPDGEDWEITEESRPNGASLH